MEPKAGIKRTAEKAAEDEVAKRRKTAYVQDADTLEVVALWLSSYPGAANGAL